MMFSRGAVLDGRVDGASTAFKRGIEYDASAKTCARGAKQGKAQVSQLEIVSFLRVSSVRWHATSSGRKPSFYLFLGPSPSRRKLRRSLKSVLETPGFRALTSRWAQD